MYHQHVKEWRERRLSLGANDDEIEAIDKIDINILNSASEFICEAVSEQFIATNPYNFINQEEDYSSIKSATDLLLFLADKAVGIE